MSPADTVSLHDIHDLTTNYSDRQGLRVVPMGLALIMQTIPQVPTSFFGIDVMLIALAIGLGGYFAIGKYYRRRFGTVEEVEGDSAYLFAGYLVLVMFIFFVGMAVDLTAHPPVFVSGLLVAAFLSATAWRSRAIRGEYLTIGVVLALLSLLPLIGLAPPAVGRAYGFWFGFMLILAGVRDHLSFIRFFPSVEQER